MSWLVEQSRAGGEPPIGASLAERHPDPHVQLVPQGQLLAQARAGGLVRTPAYWWAVGGHLVVAMALGSLAIAVESGGALGGLIGLTGGAAATLRAFHDRWLRSRFSHLPLTPDPGPAATGRIVRIRGVVQEGSGFVSPASARRAVVGRFLGRTFVAGRDGRFKQRPRSIEELRGVDFRLRTPLGRDVLVGVRRAFLVSCDEDFCNHQHLGPPLASEAQEVEEGTQLTELLREELIGPGDEVEVIGVLEEQVDVDGARAGFRSPPMQLCLRATELMPVLIREVTPVPQAA